MYNLAGKFILHAAAESESTMGWPTAASDNSYQPDLDRLPNLSRATVAGISVAIVGNVLISFALNCQKLAHRRLERERAQGKEVGRAPYKNGTSGEPRIDEEEEGTEGEAEVVSAVPPDVIEGNGIHDTSITTTTPAVVAVETQPLLPSRAVDVLTSDYGSGNPRMQRPRAASSPTFIARLTPWRRRAESMNRSYVEATHSLMPVDVITARSDDPQNRYNVATRKGQESSEDSTYNEGDYLKSKLWYVDRRPLYQRNNDATVLNGYRHASRWSGFLLMNLGEIGNFISYAFAPASVVAPLGTVSVSYS